jgi:hypothetical protein
MQAVWQHSKQSGGALVLLLAIADNAHDDGGGAYPSIDTLARKARMTGRNVNILLKALVVDGEIAIDPGAGPHGVNVYRVLLPGLATPENISPLKTFHPEKSDAGGVKNPARGGEAGFRGGVKEVSPKPSLNRQENHQGKPSGSERAARVTLATYQAPDSLRQWAEDRVPGIDFADVVENWRDWHTSHRTTIKDYDASLRTWVRREKPARAAPPRPVILDNGREVDPSTARKLKLVAGLNLGGS